jgi:hypothetical protein
MISTLLESHTTNLRRVVWAGDVRQVLFMVSVARFAFWGL